MIKSEEGVSVCCTFSKIRFEMSFPSLKHKGSSLPRSLPLTYLGNWIYGHCYRNTLRSQRHRSLSHPSYAWQIGRSSSRNGISTFSPLCSSRPPHPMSLPLSPSKSHPPPPRPSHTHARRNRPCAYPLRVIAEWVLLLYGPLGSGWWWW
jgi:hypothetical protein